MSEMVSNLVEIELDGAKVSVEPGSMVMHAADAAGVYVPHFCYHKKLSIAANCRMCLVEVEKAPKPMPACATPVTPGMVVRTKSEKAIKAQQSVMEFLLINHPLDCPICDQGGECQLQDLAVGYGGVKSRYSEEKRVVFHKNVGPLISMEEMSRCIHCTRCVRFGQEIAGVMELGMLHRGEHSEITTFVGNTVDSELSGNMIDICPVGALTSKPFRYSARTWELSRRKSVSAHDSTGANIVVQVKADQVMRVVPLENEAVNECWLADRDRFAYEGLNHSERLTEPLIKQNGQWQVASWQQALDYVADGLKRIRAEFGAESIGAIAAPWSTTEELHLLAQLVRGLGSDNVDHRLRHRDFALHAGGTRWLGMPIADLSRLDRVLVVGSVLRKDHPLFSQRIRQAARRGAQVLRLGSGAEDWLMPVRTTVSVAPSAWVQRLAEVATAVAQAKQIAAPVPGVQPGSEALAIAASLQGGSRKAVLLGIAAELHPQASDLLRLAQFIGEHTGATVGFLGSAGNAVGAQLVAALPTRGGLTAGDMLTRPMKALVVLHAEPAVDGGYGAQTVEALNGSGLVVALTSYRDARVENADVLLPIAPFTETAGSFINAEARLQAFQGVVRPLGQTRPAWKVLRVLGNLLGLAGFDQESVEEVRAQALGDLSTLAARLSNRAEGPVLETAAAAVGLERWAPVAPYGTDPTVRRAASLQSTRDAARSGEAGIPPSLWASMGLRDGDWVRVTQGTQAVVLPARCDTGLPDAVVQVNCGTALTADLPHLFGALSVEKA